MPADFPWVVKVSHLSIIRADDKIIKYTGLKTSKYIFIFLIFGLKSVPIGLFFLQPEEKMKFDSIFESLGPVGGILTGDKVKPVLLNSKLPVDILGRVWLL